VSCDTRRTTLVSAGGVGLYRAAVLVIDEFRAALRLSRLDAARWVRPEETADPREVTPKLAVELLMRHLPLRAMVWLRFAEASRRSGIRGVSKFVQRRLYTRFGLEISPSTPVGGGLYIAHPSGCVLHAHSIGENVSIAASVTLGTRTDAQWPTIESNVYIGAGARVLGGITIGAGARVGANAVVVRDVPAGLSAIGVPARVVER
jgi:serine O-acetyltransferase